MAGETKFVKILMRQDTEANLQNLEPGELGIATDTGRMFKGATSGVKGLVEKAEIDTVNTKLSENEKKIELIGGSTSKTIQKMINKSPVKIVCFGDSNTYGQDPFTGQQVENPYPKQLQEKLRSFYNNPNITVINKGYPGLQTDDAIPLVDAQIISQTPDMSIIMLGANDLKGSNYGSPLSLTEFKGNLETIVKKIRDANIEVALMTPPANIDPNNFPIKIMSFAEAVQEVAKRYNLLFINLLHEMYTMFVSRLESPVHVLGDEHHFRADKIEIISNLVARSLTSFDKTKPTLTVKGDKEVTIPLFRSPFVDTNITNVSQNEHQFYRKFLILTTDSPSEDYLKLNFFLDSDGKDIILRGIKSVNGGKMSVSVNGELIEVNFFSNSLYSYDVDTVLVENAKPGYYEIKFEKSKLSKGSSTGTNGRAFLSEIVITPTAIKNYTPFIIDSGSSFPKIEHLLPLNEGRLRLSSESSSRKGCFVGKQLNLVPNKKLIVEFEGKFFYMSGISWLGNKAVGTNLGNGVVAGYMLYFDNTTVKLFRAEQSGLFTQIASANITLDFNITHKIRVEHTQLGNMKIIIDGADAINHTDTSFNSGYVGLYTYGPGTLEVSRIEYAQI